MKGIYISLILYTAMTLYVGTPKISLSPFKFELQTPLYSIGTVLAVAALIIFKLAIYQDARNTVIQQFEQEIEKLKKEKLDEQKAQE